MDTSTVFIGLAALSLIAGASGVAAESTGNSNAANQTKNVLVINQFEVTHPGVRPGAFALIGFNNVSDQTIKRVKFSLVPYNNSHPVHYPNGKAVLGTVVESGTFMPGHKFYAQTKDPVWRSHKIRNHISCARIVGLDITFADGTSQSVSGAALGNYFAPQMDRDCHLTGWKAPRSR
ncbi:MAG TPA: hypothetical protein VFL15_03425 [Gammaproteobacteria bacterium]|nr:hypothetical protein [Gammaproteobacteria bacterium]